MIPILKLVDRIQEYCKIHPDGGILKTIIFDSLLYNDLLVALKECEFRLDYEGEYICRTLMSMNIKERSLVQEKYGTY